MLPLPATPSREYPRRARLILTVLTGFLLGAGLAGGAIYVKIPGIPGDVTTEGYDDGTWSKAFSGSYGVERDLSESCHDGTASLNIGAGRLLPIGMASHLNQAAASLAQAAVSGGSVGNVEIHLVDLEPEPVTFSIIKLEHAFVKDFTMETADTGRPWYQAFFVYRNIEIINRLSGPDGTPEQTVNWILETDTDAPIVVGEAMQSWLDEFFTAEQQEDPEIGGLFADLDGDGLPAILEFKLNLNPRDQSDGAGAVQYWMADSEGQQYLQISFVQRTDALTPLTCLDVEVADDLAHWKSGLEDVVLMSRTPLENGRERLAYRLAHSRAEKPKQFFRLSVSYHGGTP